MIFAHDTELALQAAAALVNTSPGASLGRGEALSTVTDLAGFLQTWRWSGGRPPTEADLTEVRALRPRLRKVWHGDDTAIADLVNALLRDGRALPQVVDHDGFGWHIHATRDTAPWPQRMAVEAAMALVDVLRNDAVDRLRTCARDGCDDVFVDLSRNRSRRFCDTTCGNRENVAAYRARRAGSGEPGIVGTPPTPVRRGR